MKHTGSGVDVAAALCLLILAFRGADAFFLRRWWCCNPPNPDPQPRPPAKCGEPLEGVWVMWHWFPLGRYQSTQVHQATTRLWLERAFDNVFRAKLLGNFSAVPLLPPNIPVTLLAVFDPEVCTFVGAVYRFNAGVHEPFQWVLFRDENKMEGAYINGFDGYLIRTTRGRYNLTWEGPLSGEEPGKIPV